GPIVPPRPPRATPGAGSFSGPPAVHHPGAFPSCRTGRLAGRGVRRGPAGPAGRFRPVDPADTIDSMSDWHLARGYRYAGVVTGLRTEPDRRDVAVIVSDGPAAAAGVFTQNRVCAAPVRVSRERVPA